MKTIKRTLPLLIIIAALFYFLPKNGSVSPGNLLAQGPTPTATEPPGPTPTATEPPGPTPTATEPPGPTPTATEPPGPTPDLYSCDGFYSPMDNAVTIKKNRALPLKGQLFDADDYPITGADIAAPPVVQVMYSSSTGGEATDVTDDAYPAGMGTDGNQFEYNYDDGLWQFNLKTKNYTASGIYTITMVSGDDTEYVIEPTCTAIFVVND